MTISTLLGSRLLSGIAAFALTGSLVGGTAIAANPDSSIRELRHEVRDQSKAQREEIKQLRDEFAAEYAKERPDSEKLERLHAEIEAKRAEIQAMRFASLMQMHDQLDAEQRARMAERIAGGHGKGPDEHDGKGKGHGKDKAKGKAKAERSDEAKDDAAERGKGKRETAERGKGKGKGNDKAKAKPESAPV
ncbi:MAG TPA: periplasmic heavy metal sensor [Enhygromyxa sp.]|nr:periplasmic heavy metal sensor [Enhygromyxa sp.]